MADLKISQLTGATTPLAGTEVLPIVQSSSTKKVTVADLTAGRAVAVGSLSASGNITENKNTAPLPTPITGTIVQVNGADASGVILGMDGYGVGGAPQVILRHPQGTGAIPSASTSGVNLCNFGAGGYGATNWIGAYRGALNFTATETWTDTANGTQASIFVTPIGSGTPYIHTTFQENGNLNLTTGNLVIGTSGKGIDFSDTPGTGTSELLNDYEEGNWTPTQGAGLTVVGDFTSNGTYTKVGRLVTIRGKVDGSTSVACTSAGIICGGLPYAVASDTAGVYFNGTLSAGGSVDANSSNVNAVGAIAATVSIYFSATYQV